MAALHIFGGTSDARQLCQRLDESGVHYSLSVASEVGKAVSAGLQGTVHVGRMNAEEMQQWLQQQQVGTVVDAAHPYATALRDNIRQACQQAGIRLIRYARPSELDVLSHPLLHIVPSVEAACELANTLGERVLLTTGSKDLPRFKALLPAKTLIARVLPTAEVLSQCEAIGLGVDQIIAMKGPFTADLNRALYAFYQPDVVITKESGQEGGYQEKIVPCLDAGIPCIVIQRPESSSQSVYGEVRHSTEEILTLLTRCKAREPA